MLDAMLSRINPSPNPSPNPSSNFLSTPHLHPDIYVTFGESYLFNNSITFERANTSTRQTPLAIAVDR